VPHKRAILASRARKRELVFEALTLCVGLRPERYTTSKEIADALYVMGMRPRPSGGEVGLYLRHLRKLGRVTCIENKTDRYRWMLP
jgi:hypothetical protein